MPGAQKKGQPRVVGLYIGGGVLTNVQPGFRTGSQAVGLEGAYSMIGTRLPSPESRVGDANFQKSLYST